MYLIKLKKFGFSLFQLVGWHGFMVVVVFSSSSWCCYTCGYYCCCFIFLLISSSSIRVINTYLPLPTFTRFHSERIAKINSKVQGDQNSSLHGSLYEQWILERFSWFNAQIRNHSIIGWLRFYCLFSIEWIIVRRENPISLLSIA